MTSHPSSLPESLEMMQPFGNMTRHIALLVQSMNFLHSAQPGQTSAYISTALDSETKAHRLS